MGHNKRFNLIQAQEISRLNRDSEQFVPPASKIKSRRPNVVIRRRSGEADKRKSVSKEVFNKIKAG